MNKLEQYKFLVLKIKRKNVTNQKYAEHGFGVNEKGLVTKYKLL